MDKLIIRGAKEHNLKNVNLEIPKNKLVVLTGISGSGKTSLAFDTIYAEGQRRYVESLSSYARQFLGMMEKPDVELIEGLSPAISIDQKSTSTNPRSTVGTITEIYDYLRLLFAKIGHPHCPNCGNEISTQSPQQIVDSILSLLQKTRGLLKILITAPVVKDRKGEFQDFLEELRKKGFVRVRIDKKVLRLDEEISLDRQKKHTIEVIVDRLILKKEKQKPHSLCLRLTESVEAALRLGEGETIVYEILDRSFEILENPKKLKPHLYSERFACPQCNISMEEIEPRSFSFNSPFGACPNCSGLGQTLEIDPKKILNPKLTIAEGGILPWSRLTRSDTWMAKILSTIAQESNFSINVSIGQLSQKALDVVLYGSGEKVITVYGENRFGRTNSLDTIFEGVIPNLTRRYRETKSDYIRREIERFMIAKPCSDCFGTRLKKEALSITVDGKPISQISSMSIKEAVSWVKNLSLSFREKTIAKQILKELTQRLGFLVAVGLDYLTVERAGKSLAVGEAKRIRLASQIGSGLSGVLYILDEPTIGLHQRDNLRLLKTLKRLRDLGNTVIVVEHDRETILNADYIFDFGPGAGEHGGEIVACGKLEDIIKNKNSLTGQYLAGKKQVAETLINSRVEHKKPQFGEFRSLTLVGASEHNLKKIDVSFPLGKFICVTGVSGSGKSTLIMDTLYRAIAWRFYNLKQSPGKHKEIKNADLIDKVVDIDQSPIGRTPRSNPGTYTGLFTYIRELFAKTPEAKARGYKLGRFSFNVKGGRCESCQGEGQIKIEMQFLPDVYVSCESCRGLRYNREALEVEYKEKTIADVLAMSVEEALKFFKDIPQIKHKLQTLFDVGLSYIKLGQPAPTLSGGEAQRVKLATELSKRSTGKTLYILDEPTTGLHFADIENLLDVLHRLVGEGNTVIVIEHNLEIIKTADWIIDLGPEGGDEGGEVIAVGTVKDIIANKNSYTGQYLKKLIETAVSR